MGNKKAKPKCQRLLEFIFYGNYFYGTCAITLSVEAMLQQHFPLNNFWYFFVVFISTVLYYAYPYIRKNPPCANPRTNWYTRHYTLMRWNQIIITVILLASSVLLIIFYRDALLQISLAECLLIAGFPVVAAFYYGIHFLTGKYTLRRTGWLKPFIIGFIWAGLVTIYPVLFYNIINRNHYEFNLVGALLFIKNFMFITALCIMFDIKDYASDYISHLRTFVVKIGLRKTIFYLLFPLSVTELASFVYYAAAQQFNAIKILLNAVPFIFLIMVIWSLRKRRTLMYYLVIVDGLMLVKAFFGTIAMAFF